LLGSLIFSFFLITGPLGAFSKIPSLMEKQVEFITNLIGEAEKHKVNAVEASQTDEDEWVTQ
jgi:hypothetical protein